MGQLTQSRNDVESGNDWCSLSSSAADFNTPASEKGVHQVAYKECLPTHCQYFHHLNNCSLTLISNSAIYLCVRVTDLSRMRTRKSRRRIVWMSNVESWHSIRLRATAKKSAAQRASKLLQLLLHLALLAHRSTIPQWLFINGKANNYS